MTRIARTLGVSWALVGIWTGPVVRAEITSPKEFLGYEIGEYLTDHEQMLSYMRLLDSQSDRIQVVPLGRSYERREMILIIVSSPENLGRLETIRADIDRLRDALKTSPEAARSIIEQAPAVAWMNYANDGNESAAFEAAIQVAYQLAAGTDETTANILKNLITIINPAHNPDSHQRYVTWFKAAAVGPQGTADPQADEHHGDWRMSTNNNHYQIDLNRDAFAATQQETRAVVEQLHHWNPQVFVDHHGETENYFFAPYARPVNKNLPESTREWAELYGKANAHAFAEQGWSFFAREVFDLFYAGYWDSYPALNGAIGMTYETAGGGSKGFQMEREDKSVITLRDGVMMHVTASIATLRATAENRHKSLLDYYQFRRSALDELQKAGALKSGFILVEGLDPGRTAELAELLRFHRIEVYRLTKDLPPVRARSVANGDAQARAIPAGSYFVPLYQNQVRLVRSLLQQENVLEEEFLKQVRKAYEFNLRKGKDIPTQDLGFYDITAWTLPLAYGVDALKIEISGSDPEIVVFDGRRDWASRRLAPAGPEARYGYLFSFQTLASSKLLARLLAKGYNAWIAAEPFTKDGREFIGATALLRTERSPDSLHRDILQLAAETGVEIFPVDSAWTEKGILLGSRKFEYVQQPKIAILHEPPTSQRSYGSLWFCFEKEIQYPFTALSLEYLDSVDLGEYDVLIFPDGSARAFVERLGKKRIDKIKEWIEGGGVFIGVKGAAAFAASKEVKWTDVDVIRHYGWSPAGAEQTNEEKKEGQKSEDREKEEEQGQEILETPGAILRANLDTDYYLTYGYAKSAPILINSDFFLSPSKKGQNVAVIDGQNPLISGFMFDESREEAKGKAYLVDAPMGKGHVVLFADDPLFRLFWKGLYKLFLNSIFLAPGRNGQED